MDGRQIGPEQQLVLVEEIDLVWWGREGNRIEVFRVAEIERGVGRIERLDVVDGDNAVARSIMAVSSSRINKP